MAKEHVRWMVPDYLELYWHSWGDGANEEFVVFNNFSGETHCLNFTAALVLQYLEEHAVSADAVAAAIQKVLPADANVKAFRQIRDLLEEFDQVGLIAPVFS